MLPIIAIISARRAIIARATLPFVVMRNVTILPPNTPKITLITCYIYFKAKLVIFPAFLKKVVKPLTYLKIIINYCILIKNTMRCVMLSSVNYWTAFSAGVLSFFSPCLLPLVPAYIMYLTGSYVDRKKALIQTLGFIIGFTTIFMLLGISASALGKILIRNKILLGQISGLAIVFFGLNMIGILKIPFLTRDHRKNKARTEVNFTAAIAIGMAFAFGWTPCFGPILGAILASTAALSKNVAEGVQMLFIYSMGMAVPFLLTAFFIEFFDKHVAALGKGSKILNRIAGVVMVAMGALIFFNKIHIVSNFLLKLTN